MYYAMMNHYANETSDGFTNTWYPVAFSSMKERNEAIKQRINAARIPTASELRSAKKSDYEVTRFEDLTRKVARL
jgi:hypothetical protein